MHHGCVQCAGEQAVVGGPGPSSGRAPENLYIREIAVGMNAHQQPGTCSSSPAAGFSTHYLTVVLLVAV